MPTFPFDDIEPRLGAGTFVAPDAIVVGDVVTGPDVSFWFQTVTRGDVNRIRIGAETNIQDGSILHVTHDEHPLTVGSRVVVGHSVVLHGCTVEDGALVGIGARVLDGAVVEAGAQVGAGALVAPGTRVAAGQLAVGLPARVVRPLSDGERRVIEEICDRYLALKETYAAALSAGVSS